MENDEIVGDAARRETEEEAGARNELVEPHTMLLVPHVNTVHVFHCARLFDQR